MVKNLMIWLAIAAIAVALFQTFRSDNSQPSAVVYSGLFEEVRKGEVSKVEFKDKKLYVYRKDGSGYYTYTPLWIDKPLAKALLDNQVMVEAAPPEEESRLLTFLMSWFPMLLIIGAWIYMLRQVQGGDKGAISFGKNRAWILEDDQIVS